MSGPLSAALALALLSGPPGEETATSNQPVSVSDRPLHLLKEDPEVTPAKAASPVTPTPMPSQEHATKPKAGIPIAPPTRKALSRSGQTSEDGENAFVPSGRTVTWWTTTGIGLLAVLVAIYFAGRIMRRALPGSVVGDHHGPMQLLHRSFLSPRHSVCLMRCGDRMLLIGLSGDRMQTLSEIHDPQEIDFIRGQLMQIRPRSTSEAFRQLMSGKSQLAEAAAEMPEPAAPATQEATAEASDAPAEEPRREFVDHLSSLRDQISRFRSRARST